MLKLRKEGIETFQPFTLSIDLPQEALRLSPHQAHNP